MTLFLLVRSMQFRKEMAAFSRRPILQLMDRASTSCVTFSVKCRMTACVRHYDDTGSLPGTSVRRAILLLQRFHWAPAPRS